MPAHRARRWRLLGVAAVGIGAVGIAAAVGLTGGLDDWFEARAVGSLPPGTSHDGYALSAGHALQSWMPVVERTGGSAVEGADEAPLTLRSHCAWGQPGRNPYRGSTEQALRMARLPPEVVREIAAMRRDGRRTDRVEIRNSGITTVSDQRWFNPRSFAMTFGLTLCADARVNFVPGHAERGDLFEVRDARGRLHSVMVPDVCGNVSVLGAQGGRMGKAQLLAAMAAQGGPRPLELSVALEGLWAALDGALDWVADDSGEPGVDRAVLGSAVALAGQPAAEAADASTAGSTGDAIGGSGTADMPSLTRVLRMASASTGQPGGGPPAAAPSVPAAAPGILAAGSEAPGSTPSGGTGTPRANGVASRAPDTAVLAGGDSVGSTLPAAPLPAAAAGKADEANKVPEPGTLASVLVALAVLWWLRRRRQRP